jgi:hypothetical protein
MKILREGRAMPWSFFNVRGITAGLIIFSMLIACQSRKSSTPVYRDSRAGLNQRVEDLLGRMTLEEKVGQLNWPCVYVNQLGADIPTKMESCRGFAAGAFVQGLGPGGGFFTLANTILHEGAKQQALFFNVRGITAGLILFSLLIACQ